VSDQFKFSYNDADTRRMLKNRVAALLALPVALVEEAEKARKHLVEETPRSDLAGQHMADLWYVDTTAAKGERPRIEIDHPFNVAGATHPSRTDNEGRPLVVNDGGNYNLLAVHEWGSKSAPYKIEAKNAPFLHFKAADGNWVRTKIVPEHPGVRASGMVRKAHRRLQRNVNRRIKQLTEGRKKR